MDIYGVIGDPIEHTASPAMFTAAFDAHAVDAAYVAFHVQPAHLEDAISGAAALGISGLNVTIPHKETVCRYLDLTGDAAAVGAVNTIDFSTTPPMGDNTDVAGLAAVLDSIPTTPGRALIVGAGGAARAYSFALDAAGWEVVIANRTVERARTLAAERSAASAITLEAANDHLEGVDLVLNATPIGMGTDESPLDGGRLTEHHVVIDAVYQPRYTRLLADAEAAGSVAIGGDRLLLEQACAAYERWRNEPAPIEAMREALGRSLTREACV